MQDASESHPIAGVFPPRLVARLQRDAFDGALRFHSGAATRVVYFRRGDIASAASNAESDRLHNILIGEGRLTGPQVDMARSRLKPGATLGKTLIDLGFLTPSELLSGARRQVKQILASCFALTEGVYQIAPGPVGPEVTNLGLPARRLIFDALMESGDRRAIVGEMGSMESIYAPTPALGEALAALRLDAAAEGVARCLDGAATLREISGQTHLDDFTVSKIVLALEILGLAEARSRPGEKEEKEEERPAVERAASVVSRPGGRIIPIEMEAAPSVAPLPVARPAPALVAVQPAGPPAAVEEEPAPARAAGDGPVPVAPRVFEKTEARHPDAPQASGPAPASAPTPASAAAPRIVPEPYHDDRDEAEDRGAPEAAEPPPFADDELPAFAVPEGGIREVGAQDGGWRLDPETGERVREGPVEMTFDGPVVPRSRSSSAGSRWLGIGISVAVVAVAGLLAIRLRQPSSGTAVAPGADVPTAFKNGTPPAHEPEAAVPSAPAVGSASGSAAEPPAGTAAESPSPTEASPPKAASPTGAPPATPPRPATPPTRADAPVPAAPAPAASRAVPPAGPQTSAAAAPDEDDFGAGQARLDSGDIAGAATLFSRMAAAAPATDLTLQVAIACDPENITKARRATRPDGPFFVIPFRLQERSCWRLCWGRYGDREAARAAATALPPYFTTAGVTPVVVSFGRLRTPG